MNRKHVVVTGGASGLGLGCATRFRKLDWDVTIVDVNMVAADQAVEQLTRLAGHGRVRAEKLDLSAPASILALAQRLQSRGEAIDVLVNNAGIYPPSQRKLTAEGHELTFAIAHLGHFRLTQALWPLLEAAPAARVVSISSMVQRKAQINFDDPSFERRYEPILAYQQAKLACLMFALEFHERLQKVGSRVSSYAAHPGVCRTQIGRNRPRSDRDSWFQRLSTAMLAGGLRHVGQSPENGALPVVLAATATDLPAGSFVGPRWLAESFGPPVRVTPGKAASNADQRKALWTLTETLAGSRWL
jgi:NAD(P)-dependent dehydrogenase (short-subunit alcohol dehydrogenase family)